MSIPKICPVLLMDNPVHMSKCREDGCAWWDQMAGACCMVSGADYLHDAANRINTLNRTKRAPASAANADEGKVEQNLPTASTSIIPHNQGGTQDGKF